MEIIPAYARRLIDLRREGVTAFAKCWCGHKAPLDVLALVVAHGPNAFVKTIEPRLRCKKCGAKETCWVEVEWS